ncbi:MAG: cupin domain-containing protein [Rubrobacteraceae bacterium]|nr:cupin domain-containing protein [Rubrobacteraceae bacterium]MDQ5810925.1 cupin domain-containing protein [Actinomycetota bacterium]
MSESDGPGEQGTASEGIILGPGEGRTIPGTDAITLKATSEETGGSIGFIEATDPPGTGPPRHIHHSCDELFYVLEGEFLFLVGERQVSALPGTFVFIPRGTVHAAKIIGTEPGKVLAAYIPGGLEHSFEEFARLRTEQGEEADRSRAVAEINEKYDSEFVGPPL